jgi:biopolymer transport protein ExbD
MKKPQTLAIEVDMVPMIDIISLLLMFLIVVGGAVDRESNVQMKLPRADQAVQQVRSEGRLVVQLQPENGKYRAIINSKSYELVREGNATLDGYLERHTHWMVDHKLATQDPVKGTIDIPVKLRIPEDAPMNQVELLVMAMSRKGLVNIQYAALPH